MTIRHRLHAAFVALSLLPLIVVAAMPGPLPRLSVSANHRFLQQADGSPFFWLGDTAWLLFSRLDRTDTRRYLDDRQAKGFTPPTRVPRTELPPSSTITRATRG